LKKKALALLLAILLPLCNFRHEVKAETLGPVWDRSEELNVTAVIEIHSPQNITYSTGEILLNFTLVYEGQDYDVGYDIDGGVIERISVSKISEEPAPYLPMPPCVKVTCRGIMVLRDLSDGVHTVTVYGGYYYGGTNQRYEVFKHASISFTVDIPGFPDSTPELTPSPAPTSTPYEEPEQKEQDLTAGAILAVISIVVFLGLLFYFIKKRYSQTSKVTSFGVSRKLCSFKEVSFQLFF
jgi:hypothetical protein